MTTLTAPITLTESRRVRPVTAIHLAAHLRDLLDEVAVRRPDDQPTDLTIAAAINRALAAVPVGQRPTWSASPSDPRPVLLRAAQHALGAVMATVDDAA